ncbi:phage tail protein [Streptomyces sp. AC495_CC817]|uniref:phage tail protein n=1 Tax=Streptomyces sp. AC495_CC817 TaxID=2823900 RepID=UPI001C25884F|nr:phage tail protein [Streptomyces sp. AC495_CC817]
MANRTLAYHDEGADAIEAGEHPGMHAKIEVQRSSAGAPGLIFTITYDDGLPWGEMSVTVPDGVTFLAPVIGWLNGNDPEPYVDQWNTQRSRDGDPAGFDFDAEFRFAPRPGYNQDRGDYE